MSIFPVDDDEGTGTIAQTLEMAPTGREVWRLDPRFRLATFHPAAICNPGMRIELDNVYKRVRDCALLARASKQHELTLDTSSLPPAISGAFRSWLFSCTPFLAGPETSLTKQGDHRFTELLPGETEKQSWERRASVALSLFTLMGGFGKVQYIWVEGFDWKTEVSKHLQTSHKRIRRQNIAHTQKLISRSLWEVPSLLPAYNFSVSNLVRRGVWSSVSCDLKQETSVSLQLIESYEIGSQNQRSLNSSFVGTAHAVARTNGQLRTLAWDHGLTTHKQSVRKTGGSGFTTASQTVCAQLFARDPSASVIAFRVENNKDCVPTNLSNKLYNQFSLFGVNKGKLIDRTQLRYKPSEPSARVPDEAVVATETVLQKATRRLAQFFVRLLERFGFMRPMAVEHALGSPPPASRGAVLVEQSGEVQLDNQLLADPDVAISTFVNITSVYDGVASRHASTDEARNARSQDCITLKVSITLPDLAPMGRQTRPNFRAQAIALIEQLFQRELGDSQDVPLRVQSDTFGSKWTVSLQSQNLAAVQAALGSILHAGEDDEGAPWSFEHDAYGVQARSLAMLRQACLPDKRLAAASTSPILAAEKDKRQQFITALKSFLSNDFPADLSKVNLPAPTHLQSLEPKSAQHLLQMACLVHLVERGYQQRQVVGPAFSAASFTDIREPTRLSHAFCARAEKIIRSIPHTADVNSRLVVAQDLYDLVWKPLFHEIASLFDPMMDPDAFAAVTPENIRRNRYLKAQDPNRFHSAADSFDAKLMSLQKTAFHLIRLYGDLLTNTQSAESLEDILQLFLDQDNEGENKIILALALLLHSKDTTPASVTKKYDISKRMKEIVEILDPRYPGEMEYDGFLFIQGEIPRNILAEVRELREVVEPLCLYLSRLDIYYYCDQDPTHFTSMRRRLTTLTTALFATDLVSEQVYDAAFVTDFEECISDIRRFVEGVKPGQDLYMNRRITEKEKRKVFEIEPPEQYTKGAVLNA